jgi:flagellar FliL protein
MAAKEEDEKVEASLDDADHDDGQEKPKKSSKMLFIIVGVVLLLAGGGAAAYLTGALDSILGGSTEQTEEAHGEEAASDDGHGAPAKDDGHGGGEKGGDGHGAAGGEGPYFLVIPDQRVNLNSEGGPQTFLQLRVQLELNSAADMAKVESFLPRIIDQFQTYLRELRVRDLKGSAGIYRLQAELLNRVNAAAAPIEVKDVLFQEILIQEN